MPVHLQHIVDRGSAAVACVCSLICYTQRLLAQLARAVTDTPSESTDRGSKPERLWTQQARTLTDKVVPLDGLDHTHVWAGLLLHVHLLNPHQLIAPCQVSNEQSICHPVCLQATVSERPSMLRTYSAHVLPDSFSAVHARPLMQLVSELIAEMTEQLCCILLVALALSQLMLRLHQRLCWIWLDNATLSLSSLC